MALFKKKTEKIVETDMPAEQTEAVQDAPSEAVQDTPKPKKKKKSKDMLSSVLHESVVEAAIELFAANEPFIVSIQGETQYVGLFLDTEDIGGLSKKQAKDEAKGSIVECMNAGRIAVYVTPDMLESECLVIIPNAISLDAMEEFGLLSDAPYKAAYISEDGEVSVTDTDISFADAQNILLNGKSIAEVLSLSDESDEDVTPVDESEEEPDFSEDDLEPSDNEVPYEEDEPEPDFDDGTSDELSGIGDELPFGPGEELESDDSPADEPEPNVSEYDDTVDEYEDDEPEEEPLPEDIPDEMLEDVITRTFYSDELGLEVTTEPFDSQFMHGNPYIPFIEDRGDGWLNGYLSEMGKNVNLTMKRMHQENLFKMRERYYTLISMHCEEIERKLDISDADTDYGKLYQMLQDKKAEDLSEVDRAVSERKNELNAEWEKKLSQVSEDAARVARQQYQDRFGRQHEEDLYHLEPNIREDIEQGFQEALRELNAKRSMEAKKLLDYGINETLSEVSKMYMDLLEKEKETYTRYTQEMQSYLDEHRKDEVARIEVLDKHMRTTNEVEKVLQEKEAEMKALASEFDAKREQLKTDVEQMKLNTQKEIDRRTREAESKLQDERIRNDKLQSQLDALMESYEKLDRSKNVEYESRINELKQQNQAWQEKYDFANQSNKRSSHLVIALVAAIAVVFTACGFIGGCLLSQKSNVEATQSSIDKQMSDKIDAYLEQMENAPNEAEK